MTPKSPIEQANDLLNKLAVSERDGDLIIAGCIGELIDYAESLERQLNNMKIKRRVDIPLPRLRAMLQQGLSINRIAKEFGCDWSTVKLRINENPDLLNGDTP